MSTAPDIALDRLASAVVSQLIARAETVAVAESLTGGLVSSTLAGVPGVSAALRGGIVAYATELKHQLLGVDAESLARDGAVAASTAEQMAVGVAHRCGATWGLATTGVAGPDPQEGHPAGTVFVAVSGPGGAAVAALALAGDRQEIRRGSVLGVLELLQRRLSAPREC